MFKVDQFNKLPNGKEITFPKLKANETARYKLLNIRPDPFNEGKFLIPASKNIPATDTILVGQGNDKEVVRIACIKDILHDGRIKLRNIIFNRRGMGQLILKGNNAKDVELYGYFEKCNYNASNPDRDPDAKAIFYRVDEERDADANIKNLDEMIEILSALKAMGDEEMKLIAISLGADPSISHKLARDLVYKKAEADPKKIKTLLDADEYRLEAIARESTKLSVLDYNKSDCSFAWSDGGELIFKHENRIGVSAYHELAQFLSKNHAILEAIQLKISAKKSSQ